MIKKEKKTFADGTTKTYIKVVEGYRPGPKLPPKQRTIKSFGYLEDQLDPEAFMEEVALFDRNRKNEGQFSIPVAYNTIMYQGNNKIYNYGYRFLTCICELLHIDEYIYEYARTVNFHGNYSLPDIFKFLVVSRILNPDSKRADIQRRDLYYGMDTEFTLPNIYRALDHFSNMDTGLQKHLRERISELSGGDLTYGFYDVTNYYTEIDFDDTDDGLRKRGVSKEHRTDPIIQMGLFMDSKGMPVSMKLFPGNTSDSITLRPVLTELKEACQTERIVVVADKGLNSLSNLDYIVNNGDGFVFLQILRGTKGRRYHDKLFCENDWIEVDAEYRYKVFDETYVGHDDTGRNVERKRKVLIYYNDADARMMQKKRTEKLKKAERATKNKAYGIKKGVEAYLKRELVDQETGEVDEHPLTVLSVDTDKAQQDAMYDGYSCLITSEMHYTPQMIRKAYDGLWQIEQSFRMLKTDLQARPVYLQTNEHIKAHFLVCFVALQVVRLIQSYMGKEALSPERLARSLNAATCEIYQGGIIHLHDVGGVLAFEKRLNKEQQMVDTLTLSESEDELANDYKKLQSCFHVDFLYTFSKQEVFNRFLNQITPLEHNKNI